MMRFSTSFVCVPGGNKNVNVKVTRSKDLYNNRTSKKRSLCSDITHKNKRYYQPHLTIINIDPTNHRQGVGVVGFFTQ